LRDFLQAWNKISDKDWNAAETTLKRMDRAAKGDLSRESASLQYFKSGKDGKSTESVFLLFQDSIPILSQELLQQSIAR